MRRAEIALSIFKQRNIPAKYYEEYTQFKPVAKQVGLNKEDIQKMLSRAYREYYFRPGFILKLLKWKMRELWL